MDLEEILAVCDDPELAAELVAQEMNQNQGRPGREVEVHNWLMLLTARTGYPTAEADVDRAAAALAVLWEAEEEGVRKEVLDLACRHVNWNKQWVEGLRKRLEAMGKQVEVPDPVAPF